MFKKILVFLSLFTLIALGGCSLFRAIKVEIPDQQVTEGEELVIGLSQFVLSSVSDGISFSKAADRAESTEGIMCLCLCPVTAKTALLK